jgi:hypothetical protein
MLARPTTDQVLDGIVASLTDDVLPAIQDEPARVAVQMIVQLARSAAVRSAHEIAWMHEEIDAVRAAGTASTDAPVGEAVAALDEIDFTSLHLADVQRRYDAAGEVLSRLAEAAFADGTAHDRAAVRELLAARSAHEMAIVGQLDLVGRG